jgi:hypothetical protein
MIVILIKKIFKYVVVPIFVIVLLMAIYESLSSGLGLVITSNAAGEGEIADTIDVNMGEVLDKSYELSKSVFGKVIDWIKWFVSSGAFKNFLDYIWLFLKLVLSFIYNLFVYIFDLILKN